MGLIGLLLVAEPGNLVRIICGLIVRICTMVTRRRFRQVAVELKHMQLLKHLDQELDLSRAVTMQMEMLFRGVVYYKDELNHLEGLMDAALSDRLTSTELGCARQRV